MPEPKPKLWLPKGVSYRINRKNGRFVGKYEGKRGTKAFTLGRIRLPAANSPYETSRSLRKLAHQSEYFIKPVSRREREIRKTLAENGIRIEPELEDLKDGRSLFGSAGHSLDSLEGYALFSYGPRENIRQLEKIVGKMHALGIVHNHLHHGNIAIDTQGNLTLIDLHKARRYSKGNKEWTAAHAQRIAQELYRFADSLATLHAVSSPNNKTGTDAARRKEIMNNTLNHMLSELKNSGRPLAKPLQDGLKAFVQLS